MCWSTVPNTPTTTPSCLSSQILFNSVCSRIYFTINSVNFLHEVFKYVIGLQFVSSIRSLVSANKTILPVRHHPVILLLSENSLLNALSKSFCVTTSFFHQQFCTPSIPRATQLFLLLFSFVSFSVLMSNSFITVTFSPSHLLTSSIQGIFGALSFFSQMPTQNLMNFSISGIFPSRFCSPSNFFKKAFWSRWNQILSCSLILFSIHFSNLTFLYLSLSIHCSFGFSNYWKLVFFPFALSVALIFLFFFFVALLLTFLLESSLLVLVIH